MSIPNDELGSGSRSVSEPLSSPKSEQNHKIKRGVGDPSRGLNMAVGVSLLIGAFMLIWIFLDGTIRSDSGTYSHIAAPSRSSETHGLNFDEDLQTLAKTLPNMIGSERDVAFTAVQKLPGFNSWLAEQQKRLHEAKARTTEAWFLLDPVYLEWKDVCHKYLKGHPGQTLSDAQYDAWEEVGHRLDQNSETTLSQIKKWRDECPSEDRWNENKIFWRDDVVKHLRTTLREIEKGERWKNTKSQGLGPLKILTRSRLSTAAERDKTIDESTRESLIAALSEEADAYWDVPNQWGIHRQTIQLTSDEATPEAYKILSLASNDPKSAYMQAHDLVGKGCVSSFAWTAFSVSARSLGIREAGLIAAKLAISLDRNNEEAWKNMLEFTDGPASRASITRRLTELNPKDKNCWGQYYDACLAVGDLVGAAEAAGRRM